MDKNTTALVNDFDTIPADSDLRELIFVSPVELSDEN